MPSGRRSGWSGCRRPLSMVIGVWLGIQRGVGSRFAEGRDHDLRQHVHVLRARLLARHARARLPRRSRSTCSRRVVSRTPGERETGIALFLDHARHMALPCLTLTLAYIGEYFVVTGRGHRHRRARTTSRWRAQGPARPAGASTPRGAERSAAGAQPVGAQLRLRALRRDRRRVDLLLAGPRPDDVQGDRGPTSRCSQGLFLLFSAGA